MEPHPSAPSSYLYNESTKLPYREPVSGLLIGLLIITIGIFVLILIWVIYLVIEHQQLLSYQEGRKSKTIVKTVEFPKNDPRILRFYPPLEPQDEKQLRFKRHFRVINDYKETLNKI